MFIFITVLYYKYISNLDENRIKLDNYFINKNILEFISGKNNNSNHSISINKNNIINLNELIEIAEAIL